MAIVPQCSQDSSGIGDRGAGRAVLRDES